MRSLLTLARTKRCITGVVTNDNRDNPGLHYWTSRGFRARHDREEGAMNLATKKTKMIPNPDWRKRKRTGTGIVKRQFRPGKNGDVWYGFYQVEEGKKR